MQEILTFKISCLRFKETDRLAVLTILTSYQSTVKRVSKFILFLNFWGIEEPNSESCELHNHVFHIWIYTSGKPWEDKNISIQKTRHTELFISLKRKWRSYQGKGSLLINHMFIRKKNFTDKPYIYTTNTL